MKTSIDEAGRVLIPAAIRERAGLVAGGELEVMVDETGVRADLPVVKYQATTSRPRDPSKGDTEIPMKLTATLTLVLTLLLALPWLAGAGQDGRFEMRRERAEFRREAREASRERLRERIRIRTEIRNEFRRERESFHWTGRETYRHAFRDAMRDVRHAFRDARRAFWDKD